jgi:hypothetical protein
VVAATAAVGLALGPSAHAIDQTDEAGNAVQVTHTNDVVAPQFSLWPLGDNVANIETHGNVSNDGGNGITGIPWLFGNGAGNKVQVGSGGNVVAPQVALGVDNHLTVTTWGNEAVNNGNGSNSLSGGKTIGHVVDGNGNVFQLMLFQGNVFAPQTAVNGDNYAEINAFGNYAQANGNNSSQAGNGGALALVNGNGNIVQIMFFSNNVYAPQTAINGSNDLVVHTDGNLAYTNGNGSTAVSTHQVAFFGIPGIFTISTFATGNGNVTQIAFFSNNVYAPQVAVAGSREGSGVNTSSIDTLTNDSGDNGNESETDTDNADGQHQVGNGNTDQNAHSSGAIINPQISIGVNPPVVQAPVAPQPDPEPQPVAAKVVAEPEPVKVVVADDPKPEPVKVADDPEPKPKPDPEPVKVQPKDDAPDMTTGNKVTPGGLKSNDDTKSNDSDSKPEPVTKAEPTVKADSSADSSSDSKPDSSSDSPA